jgi:hypothetical protein
VSGWMTKEAVQKEAVQKEATRASEESCALRENIWAQRLSEACLGLLTSHHLCSDEVAERIAVDGVAEVSWGV